MSYQFWKPTAPVYHPSSENSAWRGVVTFLNPYDFEAFIDRGDGSPPAMNGRSFAYVYVEIDSSYSTLDDAAAALTDMLQTMQPPHPGWIPYQYGVSARSYSATVALEFSNPAVSIEVTPDELEFEYTGHLEVTPNPVRLPFTGRLAVTPQALALTVGEQTDE